MSIFSPKEAADVALRVVGAALPDLASWATKRLLEGGDPAADLQALFATADAVAETAEDKKFGGDP